MNDLVTMTDNELLKSIAEVESRAKFMETAQGKIRSAERMTVIFAALDGYGYKIGTDDVLTKARLWVDALADEIALFGFDAIEAAVKSFAKNDHRQYKGCPTVSDIILECRKLGRNPRAEMARREQKKREAELEEQWRAECKTDKKPEEIEAWLQKMRERGQKCLQ